jgi:hypothetical protein
MRRWRSCCRQWHDEAVRLLLALLLAACTASEVAPREATPNPCDAPKPRLLRLSDRQHANAIRDLLGVEITPVRTPGQSEDPLVEASELLGVSGTLAHQYQRAAEWAASAAVGERPCDRSCGIAFIEEFAPRAFRRPLDVEERSALIAVLDRSGPVAIVETVLQHPAFLYRSELREGTSYELASLLSFTLLDSIPDERLWARALDGSLAEPEIFAEEVERLLDDPRVQDQMTRLLIDWLGGRRVLSVYRNPELYPEFDHRMAGALLADLESFVRAVLISGGGPRELLESGLLMRPGLIAAYAHTDAVSVVHQGLFIRRAFLCGEPFSSPPAELVRSVDAEVAELDARQRAQFRIEHEVCGACHRDVDPYGLPFLAFDSLGRAIGDVEAVNALSRELAGSESVSRCIASHLSAQLTGSRDRCAHEGTASFRELIATIVKEQR